ncbi:MAG: NUDIX domain-containing protein [Bacteroidetes bacterium]|nr:NUDIX domain-containing protein [Bacteroidota bacterium]
MYKVFYNDRAILLAEKAEDIPKNFQKEQVKNKQELFTFLDSYFSIQPAYDVVVVGYHVSAMMDNLTTYFKFIKAAGGLVKNSDDEFLFIKRWGTWDLPKGKVEKNESLEMAAIREVEEETNVGGLMVQKRLEDTFHVYRLEETICLKQTAWYFMVADGHRTPKPQMNEGITDVVWLDKEESRKALSESYRSLKETMMHYF